MHSLCSIKKRDLFVLNKWSKMSLCIIHRSKAWQTMTCRLGFCSSSTYPLILFLKTGWLIKSLSGKTITGNLLESHRSYRVSRVFHLLNLTSSCSNRMNGKGSPRLAFIICLWLWTLFHSKPKWTPSWQYSRDLTHQSIMNTASLELQLLNILLKYAFQIKYLHAFQ